MTRINRQDFAREKFFKILENESPRGIIIVGVALLESNLKDLLKKRFVSNKELSDLLKTINFNRLVKLAYFVGCISEEDKRDLLILNKIRNEFAHNWGLNSFNDVKVVNDIYKLRVVKEAIGDRDLTDSDLTFVITMALTFMYLYIKDSINDCEKIPKYPSRYIARRRND